MGKFLKRRWIQLAVILVVMAQIGPFIRQRLDVAEAGPIPAGFSEYYIPGDETELLAVFIDNDNNPDITTNDIFSAVAVTATTNTTTLYYDHWENGYNFDPNNAASTYDEIYVIDQGDVARFENTVPLPRDINTTLYDGRDRIYAAGGAVTVTRAAWPTPLGTVYSLAWEIYPTKPFLTEYIIPVGEDLSSTYPDFANTYIFVQSTTDNNVVNITNNGSMVLDKGETWVIGDNGGEVTNFGTIVSATYPIQVQFMVGAGNTGNASEARGYSAVPSTLWDDEYFSPVYSTNQSTSVTDLYLYNPNSTAITINYEDADGTGSASLGAGQTAAYSILKGDIIPDSGAVYVSSAGGEKFWGIGAVDSSMSSGAVTGVEGGLTYDWGFSLVPAYVLTDEYFLGWAPGANNGSLPPTPITPPVTNPTANGSPAWITPRYDNTTVSIDYSPNDGVADVVVMLNRLDVYRAFDPDNDNTGMNISATGPIAVAWGEDGDVASAGNPYIDVGYTTLPLPTSFITLVLSTDKSASPTTVSTAINTTAEFTIEVSAYDFNVNSLNVEDTLPAGWSYDPGSTTITFPDSSTSNADPNIAGQVLTWPSTILPNLNPNDVLTITFTARVTSTLVDGQTYTNEVEVTGQSGTQTFTTTDDADVLAEDPAAGLANVGDRVWDDEDGDGIQDSGEPGIAGVTVELFTSGNVSVGTTITNSSGAYAFTDITPGDYYIVFTAPSGYVFSTQDAGGDDAIDSDADASGQTANFTLVADTTNATIDAGLRDGRIGDFVWFDEDGDGVQDAGEPGILGVLVELFDTGNNLIDFTATDASGQWELTEVPAGTYYLQFTLPTGYVFVLQDVGGDDALDSDANTGTGQTATFTLAGGETNLTLDAGMTGGQIGDFVFLDLNNNGAFDVGEPGIPNVTLTLYQDDGSTPGSLDGSDTELLTLTTNASGNYLFNNLLAGDYIVEVSDNNNVLSGYTLTFGAPEPHAVSLAAGENNLTIDFGYDGGSIGDFVWDDLDGDGVQDAGEPGLSGVTVQLFDTGNNLIQSTTTNSSGIYSFAGVPTGNYYVQFTLPSGYVFSPQDAGGDDDLDSDPNTGTGQTASFAYTSGTTVDNLDAGMFDGRIGDFVWYDADGDGIQDAGESGVDGVTVELYDNSTSMLVASTVTSGGGAYVFMNVLPGDYDLVFIAPAGYTFTTQDVGGDDTIDSDPVVGTGQTATITLAAGERNNDMDAGLIGTGSIGDFVWSDDNGDGIQDGGELGIPGVTVFIDLDSDGVLDPGEPSDVTDGAGAYDIINVPPGTYDVTVDASTVPPGYIPTTSDPVVVVLSAGQDFDDADFGFQLPNPVIGIAKQITAGDPVNNGDGTFTINYSLVIENLGTIAILEPQIVDNLVAEFGVLDAAVDAPGEYFISTAPASGGTLTVDATYDGATNDTLLQTGQTLAVGASDTITFSVTFRPDYSTSPWSNQATATGETGTPDGTPETTDDSDDGADPDPDGGNDPNEPGENDPTVVDLPVIGIAKQITAGDPVNNGDGTFTINYSLVIENLGTIAILEPQIVDNLVAEFGVLDAAVDAPGEYFISTAPASGGTLTVDATYDGATNDTLLQTGQTLAVGASDTITFSVTFRPDYSTSPWSNQATATGETGTPDGTPETTDDSDDGADPDPDGGNDPNEPGENDPTVVDLPVIGIAKQITAGDPVNNGDGTFTINYSLVIENLGTIAILEPQIVDNLVAEFGVLDAAVDAPGEYFISTAPASGGTLTVDATYDGATNDTLLQTGQTLAVGASDTITFSVTFRPDYSTSPWSNQATATGETGTPDGTPETTDDSDDGADPDPDGGNDPNEPGENDPTVVDLPVIGIAKQITAGDPVNNGDGTFTINYSLVIENLGTIAILEPQIVDNLVAEFGVLDAAVDAPGEYFISTAPASGGTLTVDATYDGATNDTLLQTGQTLAVGASDTITFSVTFRPDYSTSPWSNQATATGETGTPDGTPETTDDSDDGADPDPDGGNDPNEPGENDPTVVDLPVIGIAKQITAGDPVNNGDGTFTINYSLVIENLGTIAILEPQIVDNLVAEFGVLDAAVDAPGEYFISTAPASGGTLTVDATYDGATNDTLLQTGQTLAVGASDTITFSVTFRPDYSTSPWSNQATATGETGTPDGTPETTDDSDDGADPDPDGGNDPNEPGENDPTVVDLPVIGIAKQITAGDPVNNGDGTFTINYSLVIENLGTIAILEPQIVDNLVAEFGVLDAAVDAPGEYFISTAPASGGTLTVDATYDGATNDTLLQTGQTLAVGASDTITFSVTFRPDYSTSPWSNQATATGETGTPDGTPETTDDSDDGADPDPDGGNDPNEPGENDPTVVDLIPGSIGDFVWDDLNGDGVQDAGEPGIAGVTVYVDLNNNGVLDGGEPSDTTDRKHLHRRLYLMVRHHPTHRYCSGQHRPLRLRYPAHQHLEHRRH